MRRFTWRSCRLANYDFSCGFHIYLATRSSSVTVQPSIRSVAVLPLKICLGCNSKYLVDGMTEGLVASLSRAKALRVVAPKSRIVNKETSKTWSEIANELGVEALVVGSFERDGESIRVDSQLIDASAQELWSGSYTRSSKEIWDLKNEISREISASRGLSTIRGERPIASER